MFVSRSYTRTHRLKPSYSLIIKGDKSPNNGFLIDCVDDRNITVDKKDPAYDVDIFGTQIKLSDPNSKLVIMPPESNPRGGKIDDADRESNFHYATGPQRCGKTYTATEIATLYHEFNPRSQIVLISPVNDNKNLKKLGVKVLNCVDPEKAYANFVDPDTKVQSSMFKNSLVIFDDLEAIQCNKDLKNVYEHILSLMNSFLTTGRHQNTSCIIIRHKTCDHNHSTTPLLESKWFHFYPGGPDRDIRYTLKHYCGYNAKQISDFIALGDTNRRVSTFNHRPQSVVAENVAYILKRSED